MSLYLLLNLASISIPFLVSFHPRIKLYSNWGAVFLSIGLTLIPFIIWDVWFTESGYWGFNPDYLMGIYLFSLPIEEWLFFITIPYACIFTHVAIMRLLPTMKIAYPWVQRISIVLLGVFIIVALCNLDKWYTLIDLGFGVAVVGITYIFKPEILSRYFFTFLFMLIPFFIVNGILTGTGIVGEVVWYNDAQNTGIRMFTIPIEDSVYAFSLILFNLLLIDRFTKGSLVTQP